jgi:homoserine acetyltransferase
MKKLVLLLCLMTSPVLVPNLIAQDSAKTNDSTKTDDSAKLQRAAPTDAPKGERHEFVITSFRTESSVTLPQARVVYGTYGKLNAARDNVVLLPS